MFTAWSGFLLLKCIITQMYCVTIVIIWHTVEQQKERCEKAKLQVPVMWLQLRGALYLQEDWGGGFIIQREEHL